MIYKIKQGLVDKFGMVTRINFFGNSKIYVHKNKITLVVVKTKAITEQLKKQNTVEISATYEELLIAIQEHRKIIMKKQITKQNKPTKIGDSRICVK